MADQHVMFPCKKNNFYLCFQNTRGERQSRDERTVKFFDPGPDLIFENSVQVQPHSKIFFSSKSKFNDFEKCNRFTTKIQHFFWLTQSSFGPVLKF